MDITSDRGFTLSLYSLLNTKRGGGCTLAPVCSSWVFVSRGSTHRTKASPLGSRKGSTEVGNIMAARVAILLLIAASRGIFWILEQPKGSLFEFHPQIQAVFTLLRCYRKHIHMRDFGAGSQKPTWLYSGHRYVDDINSFKPPRLPQARKTALVDHYVDSKGVKRIKGSKAMKSSQSYPRQFGTAVARLRTRYLTRVKKDASNLLKTSGPVRKLTKRQSSFNVWVNAASLTSVIQYLSS
ncbi:unnamed protein product [Cladocopium goreaui]|uniref:Uncharacterized protein n=1 Tax=Cladocopium goreaui TaxID=2562237 RepID=A0A9P1D0C9_9DINO|nr:unnamed protein product [Cladocopium goreaui]